MLTPEPATDRRTAALDWLLGRINYERTAVLPYGERQLKLDRMRQLLTRLGSPDAGQRIVHIAGTKGKGSTAAMLASVLKQAGHSVGVYSSPHLERIEERFAIDGRCCSSEEFVALVDHIRPAVEAMDNEARDSATKENATGDLGGPTFFDIATAMALVLFEQRGVDITVLEVGLGGRLDSTNVCHPVVAAITCIGLDHTKQLGDTLELIAAEKAGIIKPGVPVISGEIVSGPRDVIAQTAREHGCRLLQREVDFDVEPINAEADRRYWAREQAEIAPLKIGLAGAHQAANAAVALAIADELTQQGWQISAEAKRSGLAEARLPARVEWFPGEPAVVPAVVIDAAHNAKSAEALADAVRTRPAPGGRTLLLALSRDKDGAAITAALAPAFDRFVVTQYLDNPRAVPPEQVAALVNEALTSTKRSAPVTIAPTPTDALQQAFAQTPADGVIATTGSFFLAAEVRPLITARHPEQ